MKKKTIIHENIESRKKSQAWKFFEEIIKYQQQVTILFSPPRNKILIILANIFIPNGNVFLEKNSETLRSRIE